MRPISDLERTIQDLTICDFGNLTDQDFFNIQERMRELGIQTIAGFTLREIAQLYFIIMNWDRSLCGATIKELATTYGIRARNLLNINLRWRRGSSG